MHNTEKQMTEGFEIRRGQRKNKIYRKREKLERKQEKEDADKL